jgi:T5SS/PEP-CTERM-associated repeat protein
MPRSYPDARVTGPPMVAINRRGDAVIQWLGLLGSDEVAVGNVTRLRTVNLPGLSAAVHAVAISPTGQAIVAYRWFKDQRSDPADAYTLVAASGKPGRVHPLRGAHVRLAAQPDGSFIAVYEQARGVVTRRIAGSGQAAPAKRLGNGAIRAFAAAPSGEIIVCCRSGNSTWRFRPAKGWSAVQGSAVTSVATAAGVFHTTATGTALVDGSGRTLSLSRQTVGGAFGTGALTVSPAQSAWSVQIEQNGAFTPLASLADVLSHPAIATAENAAVLTWYAPDHRAFWSFARP